MILHRRLGQHYVASTYKWIQNLHSFPHLMNLVVCVLIKGLRVHTWSNTIKWYSYITKFILRILMKLNLSQTIIFTIILTRSPNWIGQNSWAFWRTELTVLLLVHSATDSPRYNTVRKHLQHRWNLGIPHPLPAEGFTSHSGHRLSQETTN